MRPVVLLSGGMDSSTLLAYILSLGISKEDVAVMSVFYGQRHSKELRSAGTIAKHFGVRHEFLDFESVGQLCMGQSALANPDVPVPEGHYADENMKQTVVPNRNMILLSVATGFAIANGYDTVAYAAHAGDHDIYPDCRQAFVTNLRNTIRECDWHPPSLWAPFLHISKTDIYAIGQSLGVPLNKTWTCYKGEEEPCGKCGACVERQEAIDNWTDVDISGLNLVNWVRPVPLTG